ncbi:MAG: dephospho-CoA kinase [Dongiaceae bacterium]
MLDIPLLVESGAERRCDVVITVTAPPFVQRAQVLRRPGMSPARLAAMLARQTPDAEKRRRSDFVVDTGHGRRHTLRALAKILRILAIRGKGADA